MWETRAMRIDRVVKGINSAILGGSGILPAAAPTDAPRTLRLATPAAACRPSPTGDMRV
jgi:hypothetical protein